MNKSKPERREEKLLRFSRVIKRFAWLILVFYGFRTLENILGMTSSVYFQSAWIRRDWPVLIRESSYITSVALMGVVFWVLLMGISMVLSSVTHISGLMEEDEGWKETDAGMLRYPLDERLLSLDWLQRLVVILPTLTVVASIPAILKQQQIFLSFGFTESLSWLLTIIVDGASAILQFALTYFFLKAVVSSLGVFLEMEAELRRKLTPSQSTK